MRLKIIYVDTPFWRAEVPRLSLFYGSIDYEDIRISREDFLLAKKNGFTQSGHYLPFRQIPVLIINNYSLSQTGAMSRYCGKLLVYILKMMIYWPQKLIKLLIFVLI